MEDEMLTDQRQLVELIESAGWEITDLELTAYESPWSDEDDPEASLTITATKLYEREETDADDDDENPFKLK